MIGGRYELTLASPTVSGEYLLLMGPKGVGKTSMIVDAMVASKVSL